MERTAHRPGPTVVHAPGGGGWRMGDPRWQRRAPRDLWDRHGSAVYALACALLGDEGAAAEAVRLAMVDLAGSTGALTDGEARRRLARTIYQHAPQPDGEEPDGARLPRSMVWLRRLARLQRASLALCVYGGLTHREAATLLDVPAHTVAELITAGLREIGRLAAADADACA